MSIGFIQLFLNCDIIDEILSMFIKTATYNKTFEYSSLLNLHWRWIGKIYIKESVNIVFFKTVFMFSYRSLQWSIHQHTVEYKCPLDIHKHIEHFIEIQRISLLSKDIYIYIYNLREQYIYCLFVCFCFMAYQSL